MCPRGRRLLLWHCIDQGQVVAWCKYLSGAYMDLELKLLGHGHCTIYRLQRVANDQ